MVNHLAERLAGEDDGRPKVFRDSAITNLSEFFVRFRELNVGSSEQLDELVSDGEFLEAQFRETQAQPSRELQLVLDPEFL